MENVKLTLAVSLISVGIFATSLLSAPEDSVATPSKEASLEKQIEALQAGLDALKAKVALDSEKAGGDKAKPDEAVGHGPGRARARGFGRGMIGRRFGPGMMRRGEGPSKAFRGGEGGFVKRFDRNGDRKISAHEFPRGQEAFDRALGFLDKDGDGFLGEEEMGALRRGREHQSDGRPGHGPSEGIGRGPGFDRARGLGPSRQGTIGRVPDRDRAKAFGPGRRGITGRGPGLHGMRGLGLGYRGMKGRSPCLGRARGYGFGRRGIIGRGGRFRGRRGRGVGPGIGRGPGFGGARAYGLSRRGIVGRGPAIHLRDMMARRYGLGGPGFGLGRW